MCGTPKTYPIASRWPPSQRYLGLVLAAVRAAALFRHRTAGLSMALAGLLADGNGAPVLAFSCPRCGTLLRDEPLGDDLGAAESCRVDREIVFKEPKTRKGLRTVALPPLLVEELRTAPGDAPDHCLVFCQANGKPLHGHNITQRDLREVLKRAKVPRIFLHDLRHCHATYLLRQGVHPRVVQEGLGHSTPAITLGIYRHVLPGMQEEAAKRLEARLTGRQS